MGIIDVKRLRGTPSGVVGACSGSSGASPVAPVAPDRCPCAMLLSTGRGVLHLAREGPTARFRHDGGSYWKYSKHVFTGRGCEYFLREVLMYLRRLGVVPILSRMKNIELWCVGALRFLFRPSFATVRCSDIYRDIPTRVPRC